MTLHEYIVMKKISLKQASNELGTCYENIRRYCRNISVPRKNIMIKIQKWSGGLVSANDFYTFSNSKGRGQ